MKRKHYVEKRVGYATLDDFMREMFKRYPIIKDAMIVRDEATGAISCTDEEMNEIITPIWAVARWIHEGRNVVVLDRSVCAQMKECNPPDEEIVKEMNRRFPFAGCYIDAPYDDEMIGFFISPNPKVPDTLTYSVFMSEGFRDEHRGEVFHLAESESIQNFMVNCAAFVASANSGINLVYKPPKLARVNRGKNRSACTWYEAGFRFGAEIRAYERYMSERKPHQGGTVRPHVRRAHWHHYWTGPRDGERKLVLKWVPQSLVNAASGEELGAVGHRVPVSGDGE